MLFLDLRGHGRSYQKKPKGFLRTYSFKEVTNDILELLDHLKIAKAHFVGMSLGTILIRNLAELAPQRVASMVMGGAVTRLGFRTQTLVKLGDACKHFIPYMWLYRLFAHVLMPTKAQDESRNMFIREAKKLCQKSLNVGSSLLATSIR